jgi:dihydrolipoamide dehydrogenase
LKNAELAHTLREGSREFGFSFENLTLDYAAAVKRSRKVSQRLTKGVGFLMKKNEVDVFMGRGRLTSTDTVQVLGADGEVETLKARNVVIATGSHSISIPGVQVDGKRILSYQEAILQEELPGSVVIIGAGAIGMEFATVWSSYGVEVTVVEMLPRVLPLEDEEISAELEKSFKRRKVKVLTSHRVESLQANENGVEVKVRSGDEVKLLSADQALVAIGFRPNSADLGLEEVGVKLTERTRFVEVDERMATNVPGIWAVGDVTGKMLLAHVASAQGIVCAERIAGLEPPALDYRMMPRATYCSPQVASFGYTEAEANEKGFSVKVGRVPFLANGKALGIGDYGGFVKILSDENTGKLLGAHMIGPDVSELLPELTLARQVGLTVEEIARNVHAHPTLSEALMEAAEDTAGHAIHI